VPTQESDLPARWRVRSKARRLFTGDATAALSSPPNRNEVYGISAAGSSLRITLLVSYGRVYLATVGLQPGSEPAALAWSNAVRTAFPALAIKQVYIQKPPGQERP